MWNLEKWCWWIYFQGRNRDADIEYDARLILLKYIYNRENNMKKWLYVYILEVKWKVTLIFILLLSVLSVI